MTKTILASLSGLASDRTVLEAAVAAARIEGGHIQCLHTRIDAAETAAILESTSPRQGNLHSLLQKISAQEQDRSHHAKGVFDDICRQYALVQRDTPGDAAVSIVWKESETFLNQTLHESRFHDLTVMARDQELSAERIISVLMQSGRPLLLAPPKPADAIGHTVAVAWKATAEAARALTAASFLLAKAQKVVILSVTEETGGDDSTRSSAERLANQLAWHGIKAEIRIAPPAVSTTQLLVQMAYDCGADLLVLGAYGHSRVREFIFGGVTRDLLATSALPLFMVR